MVLPPASHLACTHAACGVATATQLSRRVVPPEHKCDGGTLWEQRLGVEDVCIANNIADTAGIRAAASVACSLRLTHCALGVLAAAHTNSISVVLYAASLSTVQCSIVMAV